jgi:hypothetical protein
MAGTTSDLAVAPASQGLISSALGLVCARMGCGSWSTSLHSPTLRFVLTAHPQRSRLSRAAAAPGRLLRGGTMGTEELTQRPERRISRRHLFKYGAYAGAAATVGPTLPGLTTAAHAHGHGLPRVLPAPTPIPGGIQIPGGPLIHVFVPGPDDVTLPFSGLQLQGLDVEPSVITDYRGFTALA